ncbi:MAG: hypothetical protein WD066_00815 [Planctomycetaceae bacterium]
MAPDAENRPPNEEFIEDETAEGVDVRRFEFIKSNCFRTIHVDGAWGGVVAMPVPYVHMAIFSQRRPIPTAVEYASKGKVVGQELKERREGRNAVVREVESELILDPHATVQLTMWLLEKVKNLSNLGVVDQKQMATAVSKIFPLEPGEKT